MHAVSPRPWPHAPWRPPAGWLAGAFLLLLLVLSALVPGRAHAQVPPAGATISNQASATYTDGSNVPRTVHSNQVITTVQQVYSLTLTANGAQSATPGSVVYYPHTLTNTGNGPDSFNLAANSSGAFTMGSIEIYADNGSGQPTGPAITSTGTVNAGATFKFIVRATVPPTASVGTTNVLTVTATSTGDNTRNASNEDTTTVTGNAVITLTKAISISSGPSNQEGIEYTLTYTNTGNSVATEVKITDQLPEGMEMYPVTSGRWSVTGPSVALSDNGGSVGSAPNRLTSTYAAADRKFEATIDEVAPGQSGTIRFTVRLVNNPAPGVLNNHATVGYKTGGDTASATSNVVGFTVTQSGGVSITGATFDPASAAAGSTVSAINVVRNTGNGTDTFNITVGANNFPPGTTFQLFKNDTTTPLVDTNGDGIVDTGPLAPDATYNVVLKAILPTNIGGATGPYTVQKTARSVYDSSKSDTATDTLNAIQAAAVDLTNDAAAGQPDAKGTGVTTNGEASPVVSVSVDPGSTAVFVLYASNTSATPDSYNLTAGSTGALAALPPGWTVEFRTATGPAGNVCSSMGATVTNTGTINGGANAAFCAVVTVPAGFQAGDQSVYFRVQSPISGAQDVLHDRVTVNAVRAISLTPNGAGQTYPGGSYVYTHTLTNNGNVDEGGALSTLTPDVPASGGWSSTLYVDTNGNGTLDAGDAIVTGPLSGTLLRGASITLFHRVIAPSGAAPGTVYPATITVTTTNGSHTIPVPAPAVATDTTTVIAGNLMLTKDQALDGNCDGTPDAGWTVADLAAKPGECVMYRVTVTNVGAADATKVVLTDTTPSHTKLNTAASIVSAPADTQIVQQPAVGGTGTIKVHVGTGATAAEGGTLAPSASASITFGVKVNE